MTAVIGFLLDAIPSGVWVALGAFFAAGVSWLAGRRSGSQAARTKAVEKRLDEMQRAKDVRDEVDSISSDDVSKRLHRWHRD